MNEYRNTDMTKKNSSSELNKKLQKYKNFSKIDLKRRVFPQFHRKPSLKPPKAHLMLTKILPIRGFNIRGAEKRP